MLYNKSMFKLSSYEDHELKQIKEALEILHYYGLFDVLKLVDGELLKRGITY